MNTDKRRFEPAFDFDASKESILLHEVQATVSINGATYIGDGEVRLDLLPHANIRLYGKFQGVPPEDALMAMTGQKTISSFSINGRQVEGFLLNIGGDATAQEMTVKWCPKSEPVSGIGNDSTTMVRVVFHLFNFVYLLGMRRSAEKKGTTMHAIEHIDLTFDAWKVEMKSLVETSENIKVLKAEGGDRITHIGCLERTDGSSFNGKDASEYLKALRFFLSFVKGGWCEPVCAVGFDESGSRVWESWLSPKESWHSPLSWFDPHSSHQIALLFPGFMNRWNNEDWSEALREVIYWYLNANYSSRGIDAGIILTQAAIERFSYEYAVKDRRLIEGEGFKNLKGSDKFRMLFSSLDVPIDIPSSLSEIIKLAKQFNWLDSPHALTDIRNSLVHPEHKRRGQYPDIYFEAWNLGLWYLELAILRVCGYSGTYGNRLKQRRAGQVEDVPWKN
jgi:hypothetical protein